MSRTLYKQNISKKISHDLECLGHSKNKNEQQCINQNAEDLIHSTYINGSKISLKKTQNILKPVVILETNDYFQLFVNQDL